MAGGVHANPADLRRFAKELRRTESDVDALCNKLMSTLNSLDWKDAVKQKVDADVKAVVSGLKRFNSQLDGHAKLVEKKAADLERFLGR